MISLLHRFSRLFFAVLLIAAPGAALAQATFSAQFSPDSISSGNNSTLTFTITETSGSPASSLAFSGTLPAGVTIASGSQSNSCDGTFTATAGGSSLSLSDGRLGGSQSCTVSVPVTSSTVGTHSFTSGDLTSSQGNSGTAADDLAVTAASGTGYSKSFSSAAVDPGSTSTLTYTFDVTVAASPSFSDYRDPAFSETLPAGLSFPSPATTSSSCGGTLTVDRDAGTLDFDGPTLTTAGTTSCTITALIQADTPGSYSLENDLIVRSGFGSTISQDTASAGLTVNSPPADSLGLIKVFDVTQANAGGSATLEFTLSNTSRSSSAANLAFSDDLDAFLSGTTFASLNSNSCGGSVSGTGTGSLSFSGGSLAAEASCTISAEISLAAGAADGTYTNTTSAVTGDLGGSAVTGSTASTTLRVFGAGSQPPSLSKAFTDNPVTPGSTGTLRYTITNPNAAASATDIAFTDVITDITGANNVTISTLPAANSCGTGSTFTQTFPGTDVFAFSMSGGVLAAGASCSFDLVLAAAADTPPGDYPFTTNDLSATVNGNAVATSGASATLTVAGGANLSFVKEFTEDIAGAGSDTELTFTVSSAAESVSTATAIAFTDDLGGFLSGTVFSSLTSDSCGGSLSGSSTLSYSGGTLDPGESCQIVLDISLPAGAANGTYTNTTSALSSTAGGQATTVSAASDSLQVITAQPLQTSKSFAPASALPGETVTLTYTLTNPDSSAGYTSGFFTDSYSTALSSLAAVNAPSAIFTNCGSAPAASGTTFGIFTSLEIAAGTSCTIAVDLLVPAGAADGSYNSLSSSVTATVNSASVTLPAMQANLEVDSAQLLLSKSYTDDPVAPGGTVTAQYTLSNLSSSAATAIAFTDDLDAALSGLVSSSGTLSNSCGAGSSVSGTSTLSLTGASLAAGGSCTFSVSLSVPGGAATSAYSGSTSAVSGTISGLAATGPAASATLSVSAFSLPGFSKSFADPALAAGGSTTLTYVITNTDSSSTLTGLRFSDDLDAALSGLAVTGGTGSNLCGSGSSVTGSSTVSLTAGTLSPGESCSIPLTVTVPSAAAAGSYSSSSGTLTENGSFAAAAAAAAFTVEPAPGFTKAFGNASIAQDGSTTLTLTVDNSASAIAASALDVTDNLPAGLVLASPSNAAATCTGGTLTATAGAATLSYTGGTAAAGASCTITADVTSSTAGSYINTTGDLTSSSGNSGTASASLNVIGLTVNTPFTADNILAAAEAAAVTVSGSSTQIEDGRTVTVTVTDSTAAQVSGSASISGNAWSLTLDLSGLAEGALTLTADASDAAGTAANQVSENLTKNAEAPAGYSAAFDQDPVTAANQSAAGFTFAGAEIGSSYAYTISSDGGGSDVTGSGTIASATDQITGLDLSGLGDGTLTLSVVLTDTVGNAGTAETSTAAKDATAPAGYSAAFDQDPVTAANQSAVSFTFAGAEIGSSYAYTISSDGGGSDVTGSGTIASATDQITGLDLSGLGDGTLTLSVMLTDAAGNAGAAETATAAKDATAPAGYSAAFDQDPVTAANQSAVGFTFAGAETGNSYAYTISSDGGGSDVTGSGTIASATDQIAGLDLSGLSDGTLTLSVVLTDTAGNAGAAETATAAKDASAPSGYSVGFDQSAVNAANQSAVSFTFAGAETGTSYAYTISSDGGGSDVTGSGTIATATDQIAGLDLAGLGDGTLTLSVVLTDAAGNAGAAETATVAKGSAIPSLSFNSPQLEDDMVSAAEASAVALSGSSTLIEDGQTVTVTVTDSAAAQVNGTASVSGNAWSLTLDLSGLAEGVLALTADASDTLGNAAPQATASADKDTEAPSGYSVGFDQSAVTAANQSAVSFTFAGAETGSSYAYTISSDGGGSDVTGSGTIASATDQIAGLDLAGLGDGTLTLSVVLTDAAGNAGAAETSTAAKDTDTPAGYSVSFDQDPVIAANQSAVSFTFAGAETGSSYAYTISSDGGGSDVTGSGTIASATDQIAGLDLAGLGDGTLTLSVVLTDTAGNAGAAETATAAKDANAPSGYSVGFDQSAVNAANQSAAGFTFAGAEVGTSYAYTISSDGGGSDVTGSGTIATATDQIAGLDLAGLGDGTLTLSVVLTDAAGNAGIAETTTVAKDASAPSGYSVSFDQSAVNAANQSAAGFTFAGAETGTSYAYTISSDGGGSDVTGSGTIASATDQIAGLDLAGLGDGTLTLSVVLTDAAGNTGAATASVEKEASLPTAALSGPDTAQSDPFEVTLQFSEAVTGLSLDGLEITGGSASDLTGSDASYSVTVTPDHDGPLTIQLSADAAQDLAGNGNEASDVLEATAELTGTPNPVPPADLDGDGVPDSFESATADRDGDGIPDAQDYDPQGYFYCEDDGRILTGGGITVTGPSGSNSSLGIANDINIVRDGTTGEYQWFAQRPGTYTVAYSYPAGGAASTARLSSGSLDVTSLLPANPAVLGSTQVGSTGVLADASLSANPVFYDTFVIEAGDPNVLANNIPMTQCAANAVTVSASDDGAEANGGVPDDAGFTISLERASTVDTVLSYSLTGTATAGADYTAPPGSVTIPAGDTSADVTVTVLEDQLIEGSETLILTLTAVTSGDGAASLSTTAAELTGTASLADDDFAIVAVTNDDLTASENGEDTAAMSFRLLGQPGQDVQLAFSGDSQCTVSPASMSFSAASFTTAQVLTISAIDDEDVEGAHSCQPAVTVSSADTRYDGFALTLAQVQVSDDLVDQIRDQLTAVLKKDLEETIKTQQRYFSRIAKGALERLQAGQEGLRCGTVAAFDVDGSLQVQGSTGNSAGSFGWDVYNCGSGRREILDGAFTLSRTDGLGTQAMLQFSRQSERFLPEQALRGKFWGGYVSRTSADGPADGSITGFGANAGIYGARALNEGLFLDYYAAAALGHHRYRLRFETATDPIHARGGYTYAAGFAGAALSGRHQLENMLISPRLGADLAFAEADDASVTATQLAQRDTGRIDIPGYNGGRIFAEVEFASLAAAEDSNPDSGLAARLSFAPRLACESSSYDGTTGCGAGFVFARDVYDPATGLRFGFEIDYEHIGGTDRLALDVHRERPFARGQGAVVTRITAPDADSLKIEHGIRLDF